MIIVLMGVTGAGKTTVGQALAGVLHWQFADADDFHSAANVAKMSAGIPLTDDDRRPWLDALQEAIRHWLAAGESVVLACSALKEAYRRPLLVAPEVKLVYLRVSREQVVRRLAARRHHYMNPTLIDSQFATLEEPSSAVTIDVNEPTQRIVDKIRHALTI